MVLSVVQTSVCLLVWTDIKLTLAAWMDTGSIIYPLLQLAQSCRIKLENLLPSSIKSHTTEKGVPFSPPPKSRALAYKSTIEPFSLEAINVSKVQTVILCHSTSLITLCILRSEPAVTKSKNHFRIDTILRTHGHPTISIL